MATKKTPAKTAAKKPTAKKTAAKKPTAKKTAAKKPAATTKSAASKASAKKPAAKPAKKPAGAKASTDSASASTSSRRKVSFNVKDKVVHPHHGAAVITKKVTQKVGGESQEYFQLEIATDQLTVFVPVANIEEAIRPVISKNQARKVFSLFKEEPQEAGSNWSRWYKVLNEKMTSGDIYQVAEVVRDLTFAQQTKGISPALKRMLSRARVTLISELQFALDVDEEEAIKKLDRALPKVEADEPA